ncbi:MAG: diguanylate cyclase [Comamonas sp.]
MTPSPTPAPSKARGSTSLKLSLILPFVVLIALLTAALGMLWYWTGSQTVATLSEQVMEEKAERIAQAIDRHMHGSAAVLEATFPQGMHAPLDIRDELQALQTRLWIATSLHNPPNDYVYYGNQAGQGMGLKRLDSTQAQLRLKTYAEEMRSYYRLDGINAHPVFESTETKLFDPRQRPWYQLAQKTPTPIWTPVYIDFGIKDLVITRARRVLSASGQFEGVVATDISLAALNGFVSQLQLTPNGRAFIMEPGGELIAASGLSNTRATADGKLERMTAANSGDALTLAVYEEIKTLPHSAEAGTQPRTALLDDGQHHQIRIAYRRVTDSAGLEWTAVVAVPHQDILAGVYRHMAMVFGLGLVALIVATLIGTRIFGTVANDMRSLTRAVRRVGQGEIDTPIALQRRDEIGELADNFQRMRNSLFTDPLTGASNRSALQHILATLTRPGAGQTSAAPFALLFVDLNRFKPLNDRWGHDNGDLALTEVTLRLRQLLREDDVIARLGGDEFVIILRGVSDEEQVQAVRAKMQASLEQPLTTLQDIPEGESVTVGISVGQALYPRDAQDAQSLLKLADQDMYRHKGPSER